MLPRDLRWAETIQSWQPATFLLTFAQHWASSPLAVETDSFDSVVSVAQALHGALRISDFIMLSSPFFTVQEL